MLITKSVKMIWSSANKKHYIERGYSLTAYGDSFQIKCEDLAKSNKTMIEVKCDCKDCKSPFLKPMQWQSYLKSVHTDGTYCCGKCVNRLYGNEKVRLSRLAKGISFQKWCETNLSKEESDEVLSRWDYELNFDIKGNHITPDDVSHSSEGYDRKGFYLKCLNHPEHKSEQRSIHGFTNGQEGSIKCIQCNKIEVTNPEFVKYFVNIEDTKKYSQGSRAIVDMKCPDCGFVKPRKISRLARDGFSCDRCSDGVSYPEKVMHSVLEQLGIEFISQLTKVNFKWCGKYKYDFYLPQINNIIEINGQQHYTHSFERIKSNKKIKTLQEEQDNDKAKLDLALLNGINNYITIDCRISNINFIKDSILSSNLYELYDLGNINWIKCHEYACNSLIKEACNLWNNGFDSVMQISHEMNICKSTAIKYLKQGTILGWCDYDSNIEIKKNTASRAKKTSIKVICINTKEIFNSQKIAGEKYNISPTGISGTCRGIHKFSGKDPKTGEPLVWMHYDDYLLQNKEIKQLNSVAS